MIAMFIGVSAAVYYSWVAPAIERSRRHKRSKRTKRAAAGNGSPTLPTSPYTDNKALDTPDLGQEETSHDAIFVKDEPSGGLSPPMPIYTFDKKGRFSTCTQDGIWWVV